MSKGRVALFCVIAGFVLGAWGTWFFFLRQRPAPETRIVYVDKPAPPPITLPPRVVTRTLYRVRTDTVVVRVPVPADLHPVGIVGESPLSISSRSVVLNYYSPDSLRWISDRYDIKPRRLGWGIDSEVGRGASGLVYASLRLEGRIDRWSFALGPSFTARDAGLAFAVRYRILGIP